MHRTIYIDIDEEITGIIDRIRKEGAADIFLVGPKNAMLTQGLLNLKLLKKEAEQLKKNVMLVTNDKQAAKVVERAGLTTVAKAPENLSEEKKPLAKLTLKKEDVLPESAADEALKELEKIKNAVAETESAAIGSAKFYTEDENAGDIKEDASEEAEALQSDDGLPAKLLADDERENLLQSESLTKDSSGDAVKENDGGRNVLVSKEAADIDLAEEMSSEGGKKIEIKEAEAEKTEEKSDSKKIVVLSEPESVAVEALPENVVAKKNPLEKKVIGPQVKKSFAEKKQSLQKGFMGDIQAQPEKVQVNEMPETKNSLSPQVAEKSPWNVETNLYAQPVPPKNVSAETKTAAFKRDSSPVSKMMGDVLKKIKVADNETKISSRGAAGGSQAVPISNGLDWHHGWENKKAEDFFMNQPSSTPAEKNKGMAEVKAELKNESGSSFRLKWLVTASVVLLVAGLIGGGLFWVYSNYPKAVITLYATNQEQTAEFDLTVQEKSSFQSVNSNNIEGMLKEIEIVKTMEFEPTGTASPITDTKSKAKGKITILNKYSDSAQTLVATTRFLSKEGKLFRLVREVEVPGMKGTEPGSVEAEIIADKPGEEFNIAASTFTIEGFKGTPKYDKFEGVSSQAMAGGGTNSGGTVKSVSSADLEKARQSTLDALEKEFQAQVSAQLGAENTAVVDAAQKELAKSESSHKEGEKTDKFTYFVTQKVRLMVFGKNDLENVATEELSRQLPAGFGLQAVTGYEFTGSSTDFDNKVMKARIKAIGQFAPEIDEAAIRKGISGKNQQNIKDILSNTVGLSKVELQFSPTWLSTFPVSEKKIEIKVIR